MAVTKVVLELVAEGDAASFDEEHKRQIASALADVLDGVSAADITVTVTSASVRIVCEITVSDASAAVAVETSLASEMATADAATALLSVANVVVTATPSVATVTEMVAVAPDDESIMVLLIAIGGGAAGMLLAILCLLWFFKCHKKGSAHKSGTPISTTPTEQKASNGSESDSKSDIQLYA